MRISIRGSLQVLWLIVCGWAGEWSYFVSLVRSMNDWLWTRELSAHPRLVSWTLDVYGLSWRVAFYRGGPVDLGIFTDNGLGIALLAGILFIFVEFLKSRVCGTNSAHQQVIKRIPWRAAKKLQLHIFSVNKKSQVKMYDWKALRSIQKH